MCIYLLLFTKKTSIPFRSVISVNNSYSIYQFLYFSIHFIKHEHHMYFNGFRFQFLSSDSHLCQIMLFTLLVIFIFSFQCRMMNKNGRSRKTDHLVRQKKKADQCILLINKYKFRIYNQLIASHYMDQKKQSKSRQNLLVISLQLLESFFLMENVNIAYEERYLVFLFTWRKIGEILSSTPMLLPQSPFFIT